MTENLTNKQIVETDTVALTMDVLLEDLQRWIIQLPAIKQKTNALKRLFKETDRYLNKTEGAGEIDMGEWCVINATIESMERFLTVCCGQYHSPYNTKVINDKMHLAMGQLIQLCQQDKTDGEDAPSDNKEGKQ